MSSFARTASAIGLAASLALSAAAQGRDPGEMLERLRQADADGDGAVSKAEFAAFRTRMFDRLDRDGDGFASAGDLPARAAGGTAGGAGDMLARADADGDGKVSRAEFAAAPSPGFDRLDADGDGTVTQAEFAAAAQALRVR